MFLIIPTLTGLTRRGSPINTKPFRITVDMRSRLIQTTAPRRKHKHLPMERQRDARRRRYGLSGDATCSRPFEIGMLRYSEKFERAFTNLPVKPKQESGCERKLPSLARAM